MGTTEGVDGTERRIKGGFGKCVFVCDHSGKKWRNEIL